MTEALERGPVSARIPLSTGAMRAEVDLMGAQLRSLSADGEELLWQGGGGYWGDSALVLFPIIAGIAGGVARVDGVAYPMPGHGFAHTSRFDVAEQESDRLVLTLSDDGETRRHYPFAFGLTARFSLTADAFELVLEVENRNARTMPCDVGFHPGFRWPFVAGRPKSDHVLLFEATETAPVRRGVEDPIVLLPEAEPTPIEGRVLWPDDGLFEAQAMVFDRCASRSVVFGVPGARGLRLDFPDSPQIALWMQPGAEFLCIEPWQGAPSPVGFTGELSQKPGIAVLAPGERRRWRFTVTPLVATPAPEDLEGARG